MEILWFIVIGIVAGWIAGMLVHGRGFGMVGDLVVGIVGALVGGFIFNAMGVQTNGTLGALTMSVIGAIVLLAIVKMLHRNAHV